MWEEKTNADYPDWVEMHKDTHIPGFGQALLKVWKSGSGKYKVAVRQPRGGRLVRDLRSRSMDKAVAEVDKIYNI